MVGGSVGRTRGLEVALAHPRFRNRPVARLYLKSGSLATSGGSEADLDVEGERVGHILDPRTGRTVVRDSSVAVWNPRGLEADVLSTALYVMGPDEGLAWAEENGIAAVFLVPDNGAVRFLSTPAFDRAFPDFERVD